VIVSCAFLHSLPIIILKFCFLLRRCLPNYFFVVLFRLYLIFFYFLLYLHKYAIQQQDRFQFLQCGLQDHRSSGRCIANWQTSSPLRTDFTTSILTGFPIAPSHCCRHQPAPQKQNVMGIPLSRWFRTSGQKQ